MRPRRRRSHSRRQVGAISHAGGDMPLDSEPQGISAQSDADGQQRLFSTGSESGISPTERSQPAHHAMPSIESQLPSNGNSLLSILVQQTSLTGIGHITPSVSYPGVSGRSSSSLAASSHSSTFPLSSSTPASESAPLNSSQSYTSSSPAVRVSASRSPEFYGGIALGAVFLLACLVAFATWLVRSRRKGSMCCFGEREDEDIENRDLGFGLGLYLDKHADGGLDSRKEPLTPFPEPTHGIVHSMPSVQPTFQSITNSLGRYSTATTRPSTIHLLTDESIRTPSRLLGPLQIKNYVSGDFASSGDEAVLTPRHERAGGRTREQELGSRRQFLNLQARSRNASWAPLSIKSSPAPNQVNIAHSASKKSEVAHPDTYEDVYPLPMPPFGDIQSRKDCVGASDHERGAAFRSNLCSTISCLGGSAPNPEEDNPMPIPGSYTHANRSCDVNSSHKPTGAEYIAPESHSSITHRPSSSPNINRNDQALNQPRNGTITLDSIGFALRTAGREESEAPTSLPIITPLVLCKKRSTDTQRKRHLRSVKSKLSSRASSVYSPFSGAPRRSTRQRSKESKEDTTSQTSMSARNRPEFLRRPTAGSVTSFSSEVSDPSGPLTDEELRAKRMMMLRARRKRGMSTTSSSGRRLTQRLLQTIQSPVQ